LDESNINFNNKQTAELDLLTIYFDGHCPLCMAEIHVLKNNNSQQRLHFIDIHDESMVDDAVNCEMALKVIHAKLSDGTIIRGPKVFEAAYQRADLKVMKYLFSLTLFQKGYGKFYAVFARFRHQISSLIGPTLLSIAKTLYPDR
jgi:predicted DCC family thiol-disulfide oxidoreductase YuxK